MVTIGAFEIDDDDSAQVCVYMCVFPTRRGILLALMARIEYIYPTRPFGHIRLSIYNILEYNSKLK